MKIWLDDDDNRPMPDGYERAYSVRDAKNLIITAEIIGDTIEELNLDNDLGIYSGDGGDGHNLLDWLVETERFYPVVLHTMNPVERANMERTIKRFWK